MSGLRGCATIIESTERVGSGHPLTYFVLIVRAYLTASPQVIHEKVPSIGVTLPSTGVAMPTSIVVFHIFAWEISIRKSAHHA